MLSLRVIEYGPSRKAEWDEFVASSKNGTFLFFRDYMDYHADRFKDCSLLFFNGAGKLMAILPANLLGTDLVSHQGLTFGGVISSIELSAVSMIGVFDAIRKYMLNSGIRRLIYKTIPHIYHTSPAEEDLYALFRNDARLISRDVSVAVRPGRDVKFQERRRRAVRKAERSGLQVSESRDFNKYMAVVQSVLMERHGVAPVHTAQEIELLSSRFSENIKLFAAYRGPEMLAGVVVYESHRVAHCQYISGLPEGRDIGALDAVFSFLIKGYYAEKEYFDFGISNEDEGRYLNEGLIEYKEGFGARAVTYDSYCMEL